MRRCRKQFLHRLFLVRMMDRTGQHDRIINRYIQRISVNEWLKWVISLIAGFRLALASHLPMGEWETLESDAVKAFGMTKKMLKISISYLVIFSIAATTTILGQGQVAKNAPTIIVGNAKHSAYLSEVSRAAERDDESLFSGEAKRIVEILSKGTQKSLVFIDETGYNREFVLRSSAARLALVSPAKKLFRIDWKTLFAEGNSEEDIDAELRSILSAAEASKGKTILYIEDVNGFAKEMPLLGVRVAGHIYAALAAGKVQVITAGSSQDFKYQIALDNRLNERFEKVEVTKDSDPFVGEKLSPDLRALVATTDPNQVVKVILQAEDINNARLLEVLKKNDVKIESRMENFGIIIIDCPVRAAQEIADIQTTKHLSLDQEVKLLRHIETTTGVSLVRTIQQGLNISLLGTGVVNTSSELNGEGIGIAIVDSGVREDHRSFVDASGNKRILGKVDFTAARDADKDEYGHGSHVASLAAGGDSANLNLGDGAYLDNYKGVAPNANILNVRVLNKDGSGTSAGLISALDWIYTNRTKYNIRVANLSLGSPSIETWRNDPLCRAVRKLTTAGIVVVAAAGNNGNNASGQKIYGAIHSPGNDPSVITVGASNTFGTDQRADDGVTTYSSRGPPRFD